MNMQTRRKPYRRYFFRYFPDLRSEPDWVQVVKILVMLIGLCAVVFFFMIYTLPSHAPSKFEEQEREWLLRYAWFFLASPVAIIILYYCFKDKETW